MSILLWALYILGKIEKVWHMKTWYSSEIFMNFDQTASNIFENNIYIYIHIYAIFVENYIYIYNDKDN